MHGCLLGVREVLFWSKLYSDYSKCTFRYTYHVTTCLPFICGGVLIIDWLGLGRVTGGVCALHGRFQQDTLLLCLLLNPPSGTCFNVPFVVLWVENVAHFFPLHTLHLDLTFWAVPTLPTISPSQGRLTTVVYRRIKQGGVRFNGGYRF